MDFFKKKQADSQCCCHLYFDAGLCRMDYLGNFEY